MRQFTEDRDLTVWLVLDRSASMTVGAPATTSATCWASWPWCWPDVRPYGNRVGALLYDGATTRVVPPGTGRGHALRIGYELDRTAAARQRPGTTDFSAMLEAVALARRRSLVIVVSDFIGTGEWDKPLLRLTHGTTSSHCG